MAIKPFGSGGSSGGGGEGGNQTLGNIPGILATGKGGTGFNAANFEELRSHFLVNATDPKDSVLTYCSNTLHQANSTIQRINASTANIPTDTNDVALVGDGVITKVNDDQTLIDSATGHTWHRTHTSTYGSWGTPVDATTDDDFTEITTGTQMRAMSGGDVKYTNTSDLLPSFTDNSKPAKVILSRITDSGNYFIACDRNNMWWGTITLTGTFTITWHWEGNSHVPAGFEYTGGENDEALIPAGSSAILSGNTRIPGENYITLLVSHTANGNTSSEYNGYYIDDDSGATFRKSTNTRNYSSVGDWARTKADIDGIADTIITQDRGSDSPVFHGIIPEISDMKFPNYSYKTSTSGMSKGDVYYNSGTRTLYVRHLDTDVHLSDLFHPDFEVELYKDSSNYVKGIFQQVANLPAIGVTGAIYRSEDITTEGSFSADDTIEIRGHKSVVTKTDRILPINLGLSHGASEANKLVTMNGTGTNFTLATASSGGGAITHYIGARQSSNQSISSPTAWNTWNTETNPWQISNRSTDLIRFALNGMAYCGAGANGPINPRLKVQVAWADTSDGTYSTYVDVPSMGDDNNFRSKITAGGSGNTSFRDYWVSSGGRPIKLSQLPAGATDGKYLKFTFQIRQEDSGFENIENIRNFVLECFIIDGSSATINW